MEERSDYISQGLYNTVWIEANPKIYSNIKFVNDESKHEKVFNFAISDEDNKLYEFNITNNGQSSSILKLDKHKIHHPQVHVSEVINVFSKRMDTLLLENNININDYDFLNIDIQGAELLALKGSKSSIKYPKVLYLEVNEKQLYKNCALVEEIDEFLLQINFKRVFTEMTIHGWGDAIYITQDA
jgi:FkbM family methyltransferase